MVPPHSPALLDAVAATCADHAHEVIVTDSVTRVQGALRDWAARGATPEAVCLVGPHERLPHAAFTDDTGRDDAVLTDNDWGMTESPDQPERDAGMPTVGVTRIPSADPALVRRLLSVRDALPPGWEHGIAVSAQVWVRASAAVVARISPKTPLQLLASPAVDEAALRGKLGPSVGRLYFNVHGSDQTTSWVGDGQGSYPVVVRPGTMRVASNAILVSEACYGARHDEPDTVALRFLRAGGSAFVGSTIIAWGPAAPPNSLADLIPIGVYTRLDAGSTLADAALQTRLQLLSAALAADAVTPQVINTAASFVAYGSPLARVSRSAHKGIERSAPPSSPGSPPGDVLGQVRAGGNDAGGVLERARQRNAERNERLGWRKLSSEPLPPGALAARFLRASALQSTLAALLGTGALTATRVDRFSTARGEAHLVYGWDASDPLKRVAAVVVDAHGAQGDAFVTRGGAPSARPTQEQT